MNCEKCNEALPYGAKYCNKCGEKVPKGAYEGEYNRTIWSKLDKIKEEYDRFFLKKITGHILFKIIAMALALGYLFFTLYGNFMEIRLQESAEYTIKYNQADDEYYICLAGDVSNLNLFVPWATEELVFTAVGNNGEDVKTYTVEQYKEEGYTISVGEYEHILIDAVRWDNVTCTIKVIAVAK